MGLGFRGFRDFSNLAGEFDDVWAYEVYRFMGFEGFMGFMGFIRLRVQEFRGFGVSSLGFGLFMGLGFRVWVSPKPNFSRGQQASLHMEGHPQT